VCSIRVFAKKHGDPYPEPTIVVHDKMKMEWFRKTSRFKKMVLSIAIDLKLTSGALVRLNSLLRILLGLWLLFKWSFRCVFY